jgi:hypothetical protein
MMPVFTAPQWANSAGEGGLALTYGNNFTLLVLPRR